MVRSRTLLALILVTTLIACGATATEPLPADIGEPVDQVETGRGMGLGMGPGSGMMERHHATIPAPYAGLTSPVTADEGSLARGEEIYSANCATCHGDGGMGDGPAGASLDPAPAPVAHTSQMLGDDYLFWRISEGSAGFTSTMPAWKDTLDEQARWDLVNYMRALGRGEVTPRHVAGGEAFDPAAELAQRAEMLAQGVEQGVITQEEADTFDLVHTAMDELTASGVAKTRESLLADLVEVGKITQAQSDVFNDVHDRLIDAGLMH